MKPVQTYADFLLALGIGDVASTEEQSGPPVGSMPWLEAEEGQDSVVYACTMAAALAAPAAESAGGEDGGESGGSLRPFNSALTTPFWKTQYL